ncbi:MAG: type II secretion system F family protein [Propionibacteriales bacterium]|nr:type II secretion system F family protein [Propionibacteriales bacterium]
MSLSTISGLALGAFFGLSVLFLIATLSGWRPKPSTRQGRGGAGLLAGRSARRRLFVALAVGLVVALLTRWPVAAIAAGAVIYLWPTMFGAGKDAAGQIERLEALAVWTETLRDSTAGAVGLEQAIRHSLTTAPPVLAPALRRLEGQMRVQVPLPEALADFDVYLDDASVNPVTAALILNSRLRGPGLVEVLTKLATSTREEIDMRRTSEEGRKVIRRSATIVLAVTAALAGSLAVFSRDFVAPYSTVTGQLVLAIVIAIFASGLMWIRAAAIRKPPERFLGNVEQITAAVELTRNARLGGGMR